MIAPEIVLLMCCVVAVCSGTCVPAQSEWQQVSFGGVAEDQRHYLTEEFNVVSYDAINSRSAVLTIGKYEKTVYKYKTITIYNSTGESKEYNLNLITNQCYIISTFLPFYRACVPAYAKRVGTFTLGLSAALNLTRYEINHANPRHYLSVQEIDGNTSVPVSQTFYGKARDTQIEIMGTLTVINFTLGIKNTSVFDIPAECKHAEESSLPEQLVRHHHFIMAI